MKIDNKNVQFHLCDGVKSCNFAVPIDVTIINKYQYCQCHTCGRVTKRKILTGKKGMRITWSEEYQKETKRALEIKNKCIKVQVDQEGNLLKAWIKGNENV